MPGESGNSLDTATCADCIMHAPVVSVRVCEDGHSFGDNTPRVISCTPDELSQGIISGFE